jgi:ribonucleotide reductase alpha subunit
MENQNTQKLAERIALLLQEGEPKETNDDFLALQSTLEKINQRLDKIESHITIPNPKSQILNPTSHHASLDKFLNLEELADEIINSMQNEKACPYEPTGKPCDHCAMCNSRGF